MSRSAPVSPSENQIDAYNEIMLQSAPESPDGMQFHHTSHEELVVNNFASGADTIYVPANGTISGIKRPYDAPDANGTHIVTNSIQMNPDDCDAYETSIKRKYVGAIQQAPPQHHPQQHQ